MPAAARVRVGSTGNSPELVETVPITRRPGRGRRVALSFGPDSRTDSPLPDLQPGDRLLAFAELEVTTDAEDPGHPGRIGNAYSYEPLVEARLLLAAGDSATEPGPDAIAIASRWREPVSHQQHHGVVVFPRGELEVPPQGLPWDPPSRINLVLGASHDRAQRGDLLLVGQNEKTPVVVQDMAGIRVVRLRPGSQPERPPVRDQSCRVAGVPVAKRATLVFSHRLAGLRKGEQLLVKARLTTDAARLGYPARISTRLFLADDDEQVEPARGTGEAARVASWKGHLSKPTGFNCLPAAGPRTSRKIGVMRIVRDARGPLFLNLVAVSAAPFGGERSGDELPIRRGQSHLEVTRYPPEMEG